MKRNKVFFFILAIAAGVLLFRGLGNKVSSQEGTDHQVTSAVAKNFKGEASQASSLPPDEPTVLKTKDLSEPLLFQESSDQFANPRGHFRARNSGGAAAPSSAEALRSSDLWADQSWKIWKGVSAVPSKDYPAGQSRPLGSIGGYVLVAGNGIGLDEHQFSSSRPLAVFNSEGNLPGLITGVFSVRLHEATDFESFVLDHNLKIVSVFPEISVFYVTSNKEPFDLSTMQETLNKDPRVMKALLEIVTQAYAKK